MMDDVKALLLVGGLGTRLRSVAPGIPKPLAPLGKRSFLELLVGQLRSQGIRRLVFCTGYLSAQIEKQFGDGNEWGVTIEYSRESQPLGTGGAVKQAQSYLEGIRNFLVINGDSFLEADFKKLMHFHVERNSVISMAIKRVENSSRYGTVLLGRDSRVSGFAEKGSRDTGGLVNAGVYVFNQSIFKQMPDGPSSLEKDIFPQLVGREMYAIEEHGMFIDIGTPEDYARAQELCDRLHDMAIAGSTPPVTGTTR